MTWGVPEISAVLYAASLALMAWYGIWLSKVMKQKEELVDSQVKAKDATIETLKTERDKLAKETAPAMASQLKQLSEYAELITKTLQDEKKKYDDLVSSTSPKDTIGLILPLSDDLIERERLRVLNSILTDRVHDMRGTIRALQHETELLRSPGISGEIVLASHTGTLADIVGNAAYEPSPFGGIDTMQANPIAQEVLKKGADPFSPSPLMGEPKAEDAEKKKKPGFKI